MPPMDISWVGPGSWDQLFPGASGWDVLLCLGSLRVSGMDADLGGFHTSWGCGGGGVWGLYEGGNPLLRVWSGGGLAFGWPKMVLSPGISTGI